jgi:hypothetical protein
MLIEVITGIVALVFVLNARVKETAESESGLPYEVHTGNGG